MPRAAKQSEFFPHDFPWEEWESQLVKSPTRALVFGPDDFGEMLPARFRNQAWNHWARLGIKTKVKGKEVLVALAP